MKARTHEIRDDLLSSFLAKGSESAGTIGGSGLFRRLTNLLVHRTFAAGIAVRAQGVSREIVAEPNFRPRDGGKTSNGQSGERKLESPRRYDHFEPQLVPMHLTRWSGFDDKILSLYARGLTVREIQTHLQEMYGAEISSGLICSITDAVVGEIKFWQVRPLEDVYPIVYLDCIPVRVRESTVRMKTVHLAIGINVAGEKEVLGFWIARTEDANHWLHIMQELRERGIRDIFIACADGSKGLAEGIEAIFERTKIQLSVAHAVQHSLNHVSWRRRSKVADDLKRVVMSANAEAAMACLKELEKTWSEDVLPISVSWHRNWDKLSPFFGYAPEIRKVVYATNAFESVNKSLRRLTKNFGAFSSDEALLKLFYLVLRSISKKWTMPIRDWNVTLNRLSRQFEGRLPPL